VVISLVIDCHDPVRLALFWSQVVGGAVDQATASPDWVALEGVPGLGYLAFQRVPEPKAVKNRVHIDYLVDDLDQATDVARAAGAEAVGGVVEEPTNRFQVMRDPEGNEFCLVLPIRLR
jgi:predicted enzyme related to lactoylglutathione lyase